MNKKLHKIKFMNRACELNEVNNTGYKSDPDLNITVVKDLSDLRFDIQQAIPCGLIVNEIITNAVKYSFHNKKEGEIYLSVKYDADKVYFGIGDNGVGLPSNLVIEDVASLGLQLVQTLVE
jgi:two-component sensor histidine kinase